MNLYNIKFEVINDNENSPIYGLVMGYVNTYITGENNEDAEKNMERKLQDRNVKIQKIILEKKTYEGEYKLYRVAYLTRQEKKYGIKGTRDMLSVGRCDEEAIANAVSVLGLEACELTAECLGNTICGHKITIA